MYEVNESMSGGHRSSSILSKLASSGSQCLQECNVQTKRGVTLIFHVGRSNPFLITDSPKVCLSRPGRRLSTFNLTSFSTTSQCPFYISDHTSGTFSSRSCLRPFLPLLTFCGLLQSLMCLLFVNFIRITPNCRRTTKRCSRVTHLFSPTK